MAGEWKEMSVAELQAAGALLVEDGNHGENRPRPDEFSTEGIQFIRAADMDCGRVLFERAQRINEFARQRVRKGIGSGGDVLLSHKGTVGKVAYVPPGAPPFVCSPQTTFWRVIDPEQLDRRYIYFYLLSRGFREQLDSRKGETDMADYVSLTTQRTLKVIVPPLAEQRAIAGVLGALDDKIELNRRMNATLEAMARALFQSWFVDFDPVRAKQEGRKPSGMDDATAALFPDSFHDSEFGHIPTGWHVGRVAEVSEFSRSSINPADFPEETFDHYSLPAFDDGRVPKAELGSAIMSNKLVVMRNSVLLSKLNPHIPRIWLPDVDNTRRSVCSTEFIVASTRSGFSREFIFSLFTSAAFGTTYGTLVSGTTGSHQRIRPESVLGMKTVIPLPKLVEAFTAVAQPMFDKINRNIDQSRTLATLRDTLLPKLLSGELRVPDAERAIAAE
jgi:type I restriction enzyme S subunit